MIHDLLTEAEIDHLIMISKPNLSRKRTYRQEELGHSPSDFRHGKRRKVIHKTVQYWFSDIEYNEEATFEKGPDDGGFDAYKLNPIQDQYGHTILDPVLRKMTRKLELATNTDLSSRFSSSLYQTTNYGLAGLCESHNDPGGYIIQKSIIPPTKNTIVATGDMIATIMAWLNEPEAGGGTAFMFPNRLILPNHEKPVKPVKPVKP